MSPKRATPTKRKRVLIVEDDRFYAEDLSLLLDESGFVSTVAHDLSEALDIIDKRRIIFDAAILDVMLPIGHRSLEDESSTHYGRSSGIYLFRRLRDRYPTIPVMFLTARMLLGEIDNEQGVCVLHKPAPFEEILATLKQLITKRRRKRKPKVFIVHGHDDAAKLQLKNYLQNTLDLGEPVILHEQPSIGRTIIEKFEEYARKTDLVFILLTPDDKIVTGKKSNEALRRARQNVIFELGFFLGALRRKKGRVILLHKGSIDLPSDIHGIVYIDISQGVESAGEAIRREVVDWL